MKVKNISQEKLIEPYFGITLEPGEVKDLSEPYLSRILVVFSDKVKLITEEEVEEEVKPRRGRKPKTEIVEEKTEEVSEEVANME